MDYEIVYGKDSLAKVEELGIPSIVDCIEQAMIRLSRDPVTHSVPNPFAYRAPDGRVLRAMAYHFHCDGPPGYRVLLTAHFYYGQSASGKDEMRVFDLVPFVYVP
jgi:hypothetical protein